MEEEIKSLREEVTALTKALEEVTSKVDMQRKSINRVDESLTRTKYYLGVTLPGARHFFE